MKVTCDMIDCIHNGLQAKNYGCQCEQISISDEECDTYRSFHETAEYQEPYYKSMEGESIGLPEGRYKLAVKGKYISINVLDFFTEDDTRLLDCEIIVTEKTSGSCGCLLEVKEHPDQVAKMIAEIGPLDDYPEIEADPEHYRKYRLKQTPAEEGRSNHMV